MRVVKLFLICLVVVTCMNAAGEKLAVPGDYVSIQAAIDAARPRDIVEVAPGIYEENLVIRKHIELRGAGNDSTIVRNASRRGELLRVMDTAGGRITGFKFEHSDMASLVPNRVLFPDAVKIINSSIAIHHCTVGPSAGCGITIDRQSNCNVEECLFEGNSQAGVFVRTEGAKATLLRNKCVNNQYGGICLTKGAKAEVEENICFNNGKWGLRVLDKGTSIAIKESTFSLNKGPGIIIEKWAYGSVEGSDIRENDENGIIFKLGANGMALSNTLEKNSWHGIAVQSLAVSVEVRDNTCDGNQRNGISVSLGAGGDVTNNTCQGNGWSGIAVGGWFTNLVVRDNECRENARHGLFFNNGAAGKIEGNRCRSNKMHGILVANETTKPDIGYNVCENNGGEGTAHEDGDPLSRQNQVDSEEIGCALAGEYFDEIEKMAGLLRRHKCRYSGGAWQLSYFYDGLKKGCGDISPDNREEFTALIERWKSAYPESATPLITQAAVHMAYGWDARGDGYAHTVTEENWKVFYKELGIAMDHLLEAEALNGNDPHLYSMMLNICNCLDYSASKMQDIFDKGIAIDLGYFPLYFTRTWFLTPRWGGKPGEVERFAEKVYDLTQEEYGYTLYALIASALAIRIGTNDFLHDHSFDREKVYKGCIELMEEFPESHYYINQYCLMACINGDQEKAKNLFDKIGSNIEDSVWRNRAEFLKWKQWAIGMTHASHHDLSKRALDSSSGASTISALRNQMEFLFESVSWIEQTMLLALLVVGVVFFLYSAKKKRLAKAASKFSGADDKTTV